MAIILGINTPVYRNGHIDGNNSILGCVGPIEELCNSLVAGVVNVDYLPSAVEGGLEERVADVNTGVEDGDGNVVTEVAVVVPDVVGLSYVLAEVPPAGSHVGSHALRLVDR